MGTGRELFKTGIRVAQELKRGSKAVVDDLVAKSQGLADDFRKRAKSLRELVFEETFTVENITQTCLSHTITPDSEVQLGRQSPEYSAGQSYSCVMQVKPRTDIPVRQLTFHSTSAVRIGDEILATIPRNKAERFIGAVLDQGENVYVDRPYKESEEAIKIKILSPEGKVTREECSANYSNYTK
jgi:hypothetical protein